MTQETLMTTDAANTTEGEAAAQSTTEAATAATEGGQQQQATTEAGTDGQKAEGDSTKSDAGKQQEGAPDKYEFTTPEGQTFDETVIAQFSEIAKELNLSQDAAQKVLDKMGPAIAARQVEQIEAVKSEWAAESKADKEFGGEKLNENLAVAKKGLGAFATPELSALLEKTGLGNNPEIIRYFYRVGKAISEDSFVNGNKGSNSTPESMAQRMYPNMNP